ncbi:MAG TPA: protein kinase [Ktedonobacteraceae bacterium]|nr:protein kinase [Ktedonobacteraceae bacterium]
METGRVIHGRYLLQRLIKQTAFCSVYQGMDQRLQRAVAVKSVFAPHFLDYRTAMKMTANFSHPHIIGLYDLVVEPEALYVVQEYVDGDSFETLVRSSLSPYEVAEMGWQMCLALMYAGSSSRRVCHGDLTPAALMRDRQHFVRINGFALPGNLTYFEKWSMLGGEGVALLEPELPWGQQNEARKADDTRAVGLLLYQLVTGSDAPPQDERLRFSRNTPPDLCETIARAVVRQHPQNINNPETLHAQLKALAEVLEPPLPAPAALSTTYQREEPLVRQYSPVGVGKLNPTLPARDGGERGGRSLASYSGKLPALEVSPAPLLMENVSLNTVSPQTDYPPPAGTKNISAVLILILGLLAFGLFFAVGYLLGHALIHP